ncbi:Hypothetical protein BN69_0924 [Methylocystis sp. SC2]|nr:Hypothetical protein BN69_0924 [Methylocystis sp. SC2]
MKTSPQPPPLVEPPARHDAKAAKHILIRPAEDAMQAEFLRHGVWTGYDAQRHGATAPPSGWSLSRDHFA